jgi:hypothetical protein
MQIQEQPETLSKLWMEGWMKRDERFLRELLHDDFRFYGASLKKEGLDKEQWLDLALKRYELRAFECICIDNRIFDQLAIVQCFLRLLARPSTSDHPLEYNSFDVWLRKENGWKVLARKVEAIN